MTRFSVQDPYLRGMTTKMKMIMPVGKKRAWRLIATLDGLSSWFPSKCSGRVNLGTDLDLGFRDGDVQRFRVLSMGEKHSSFRMLRSDGAQVRFYLHGKMTTLTIEVEYPNSLDGRRSQISELPLWAFRLANLKSVALGGPDLRHQLTGRTKNTGFID